MISTTFNAATVFLLNDPPNWRSSVHAEISVLRADAAGLTNREARRPYSATLRVTKLQYIATIQNSALRALNSALRALSTEPVIVPFWPAQCRYADRATNPIGGGLWCVWKSDWSDFELFTSSPVGTWADGDPAAPALYGYLEQNQPDFIHSAAARWQVRFIESSPANYSLLPSSFSFTDGPQPSGYSSAPKVLPVRPAFRQITDETRISVLRDPIGFTREKQITFYTQAAARLQSAGYTIATAAQIGTLVRFFSEIAAPGQTFWAPGWIEAARLTADVGSGDTTLNVEDPHAVLAGDYIALCPTSGTLTTRKVNSKTDTTLVIDSATGAAFDDAKTLILPLLLARLETPKLQIEWVNPILARAKLDWREVPAEYVPAADETLATTIGKLKTRVILFEFARDYGNGTVSTSRYTSFESDLSYSSQTWTSAAWDHGDIAQSLNLESDTVEVSGFLFSGNPLIPDISLKAEGTLRLKIRHADFDGSTVSNASIVFDGELQRAGRVGSKLKATFISGRLGFDDQVPRLIRGPFCNHIAGVNPDGTFLISYGCNLLKADWKFSATVASPVSSAWPYALNLASLARVSGSTPTYFADWFALGWIEWGTGASVQRRAILTSTNPSAGALTIKLHKWFDGNPSVSDTVYLYPGCDGMKETCQPYDATLNPAGKFANYLNFGGEPFTPAGNPSLVKLKDKPPSGAKK